MKSSPCFRGRNSVRAPTIVRDYDKVEHRFREARLWKFGRTKGSDFFDQRRDRGAVKFLAIRTPPVRTGSTIWNHRGSLSYWARQVQSQTVSCCGNPRRSCRGSGDDEKARIPGKHGVIRVARRRLVADEEFLRLVVFSG